MKDPERAKRIKTVERRIKPLVEALKLKGIETLGSCQGHFGYDEPKEVTEKAYIEIISLNGSFSRLQELILNNLGRQRRSWFKFEAHFNKKTGLSSGIVNIFPPQDRSFQKQRQATDRVVKKLVRIIKEQYS